MSAPIRKKLIEVALPLEAINAASGREKSIRHGHPSTLHLWWARRPLAAARAVIFAQMVDDPSSRPELFPTPEAQERERQRLFRLIEQLVQWENTTNETVLNEAREEIRKSWRRTCADNKGHPRAAELFNPDKVPAFHDPFAGGGALPLEAQRLGLEAYASDLNPVAVLINKAMIEIPPKFAGRPPVNPGSAGILPALCGHPAGTPASSRPHLGWHSRDYLPHFDQPGLVQSITFRLHDSVPADVINKWKQELAIVEPAVPSDDPRMVDIRERLARHEDAGHGECHLRDGRVAELVERALLHFDGERYRLIAWCIMPNHVHVLVEAKEGYPLSDILHSWKSFTAKEANKLLGRTGEFWMREYHDRFIRDENHFLKAKNYMEQNPVKAGLVKDAADWKWSSAGKEAAGTTALPGMWRGAQGLAEDVRYYGQWMRDEAEKRIGHLYPKVRAIREKDGRFRHATPDEWEAEGKKPAGSRRSQELTVIAWLWARTVKSPNPAFREVDVPLASTFMLSTKPGKEAWVEVVLGARASCPQEAYHFTVNTTAAGGTPALPAKAGTKLARGANFRCVMSGTPIAGDYIKAEGKAGRMGARLMAIVAEGERGRVYLPPTPEHEAAAKKAKPEWKPEQSLPDDPRNFWTVQYGLTTYGDLFTRRQLVALTTFSDLVGEAMEKVRTDAEAWERRLPAGIDTGRQDGGAPRHLRDGGTGATAYAEAVAMYLGLGVSRLADAQNALCQWGPSADQTQHLFRRQAIPIVWDYAESSVFSGAAGDVVTSLSSMCRVLDNLGTVAPGFAQHADAQIQVASAAKTISTDPPYYDNIGYADLSDFFYVWQRRTLRPIFPDIFATLAVPKIEELVATPYRHGGKEQAEAFFLEGMSRAMHRLAEQSHPAFPVTIYYAFKQSENESDEGTASTGWETFLDAVIRADFGISGTWPIRTERGARSISIGTNALASSIVLVCRRRAADAPTATRREFVAALQRELPEALRHLQAGNIAPVDLAQAAIGPGMAVFTRYARVLDAQGNALTVREALALINETLDTALAEQEGDFDADSRWALAWFEQHGFAEGEFGTAEMLSKAKNVSVQGLVDAGILVSSRGKVRLLKPDEMPADWDPASDARLSHWETVHQLIRALNGGEAAAAALVSKLGSKAESARELAYRLYSLCERKKRAADALPYNALVQAWPEITRLAQESATPAPGPKQGELL